MDEILATIGFTLDPWTYPVIISPFLNVHLGLIYLLQLPYWVPEKLP